MKKILLPIICLSILPCLYAGCGRTNKKQEINNSIGIDSIVSVRHNPLCDSLYYGDLVDYEKGRNDTVINGVKYFFALPLSEKYTLAFKKYDKKYRMLKYIDLFIDGVPSGLFEDSDYEDNFYYGEMLPSPSNRFVFFCIYYSTLDINLLNEGIEEEIVRFGSGNILDLEREEIHYLSPLMIMGGNWNYCDQWVNDDEVLFDPEKGRDL